MTKSGGNDLRPIRLNPRRLLPRDHTVESNVALLVSGAGKSREAERCLTDVNHEGRADPVVWLWSSWFNVPMVDSTLSSAVPGAGPVATVGLVVEVCREFQSSQCMEDSSMELPRNKVDA